MTSRRPQKAAIFVYQTDSIFVLFCLYHEGVDFVSKPLKMDCHHLGEYIPWKDFRKKIPTRKIWIP